MSITVESLELELQSNSKTAVSGIDALASSLNKLKSATKNAIGLTSVTTQLSGLNNALNSLNSNSVNSLTKLAEGLKNISSLNGLKLSSSVATQITAIGNAARTLNGTEFSVLGSLSQALAPLSNIGKSNLNSFISQLQRLPAAAQSLDSVDLNGLSNKISQLAQAFAPLSQMGKNNLTSFITQLSKIPQLMQNLKSVDISTLTLQIQQLANAFAPLATQMQAISNGFASFPNRIQRLIQNTNSLSTSNKKASLSFANLAAKVTVALASFRSLARVIGSWIKDASHSIEVANQFAVSMGEYAQQAYDYAIKVEEVMGIRPTEWMENQAVFMTISKGFGVASDRAYIMSQNLTQLGYDLTSFFDLSGGVEEAMQKLQSGISGELAPLRRLGYDRTIARLQQEALNLGITKSVSAMTQAEKAELRYYAIMTQVSWAQHDMARTLESPANQLRILQTQLRLASEALGNLFIPLLNNVLPYLIAFAKVSREVVNIIAKLLNIPTVSYKAQEAIDKSAGNISNNFANANDGLDETEKKMKSIKNAMLGIDELNVISPSESSNDGNGNALGNGLGFELPQYNFLEGAINQKVNGIVQSMKEWLGITEDINSWTDLLDTKFGTILKVVGLIRVAFAGWKLAKSFTSAIGTIGSLFGGKKSEGKAGGFSVPSVKTILKGLADIALIIGGVITIVEIVGLLMQIPGFEQVARDGLKAVGIVFSGLFETIVPLTALSTGIIALGKIGIPTVAKGFAGFATIVDGVPAVITAIGALISIPYFSDFLATGVTSVVSVFNALGDIALPLGVLSGILIGVGIASPGVMLSGLVGFAAVIGGLEVVLVALGALNQIPGFSWIVGEGGKVLIQLGEILGGFAGSIVNGFLVEVSNSFPDIGSNLAAFMTNAQPFFTGLESVNAEAVNAVKNLAGMVLILTAADVLDGLTSWLTGGTSLIDFGKDICEFAPYFVDYANQISSAEIDADVLQASTIAAKSLAEFAREIPNSGGVAGFFAGENDIDVWGAKLPSFGKNFKEYSDNIKGVDAAAVEASSTAAKSIVEFARDIPNEGGMVAWFTGDNTLDEFGAKLPSFGRNFKEYSDSIKGVDAAAVTNSSTAAASIIAFAKEIPNENGMVAWFTGDNAIDTFGSKLPSFGENFKKYYNHIYDIKSGVVQASADAAGSMVAIANAIPNEGGFKDIFTGSNGIDMFGAKLASFGREFKSYYNSIKDMSTLKISTISNCVAEIINLAKGIKENFDKKSFDKFSDAITDLAKSIEKLPTTKTIKLDVKYTTRTSNDQKSVYQALGLPGWPELQWKAYARGGFPNLGELFIARESGPEMIGRIGNRTAVANNAQIVSAVSAGVYQAIMSAMRLANTVTDKHSTMTNLTNHNLISGKIISTEDFEGILEQFYENHLSQIAEDVRRQADKEEQTIVQVGNRTITDAVTTQRKANGYSFTVS